MRYSEFLVAGNYLTPEQRDNALAHLQMTKKRIGGLAVETGYLEPLAHLKVLRRKLTLLSSGQKKLYGEIAVEMELLTAAQLADLLALQKDSAESLGSILLRDGLLDRRKLLESIKEYKVHLESQ